MNKAIATLEEHCIVCGGGETGRHIISELLRSNYTVVLIEQDVKITDQCRMAGGLYCLTGDATDDKCLVAAGIERAAGIIISLPSDKDTLYVTIAARMLNKQIRIISSMVDPKLEPKLKKAGADRVVSPNFIGALRMASEMIRPTVVEFLDTMLRSKQGNLRIHHLVVTANSPMADKRISESGLKDRYSLLVIGYKKPAEEIEFNPNPSEILSPGTTLIVMGEIPDLDRVKRDI
ncbi:Potassium channel protein [Olavius algarvensis associated proteobacterium Delta 3]|nr:Potassium channel protein [Olavius algarvensis associated proteobacterium Delta 3]CAB5145206.1 Potassium channel protein [Olavius algarvensis associated proteobacterium Delta 3]